MGKRGPPPLPANVHQLRGNPSKKSLASLINEFRPAVSIPRPPAHVRKNVEALREWKRVTRELAQYGLIAEVDRADLTFYCVNWARHCEAEDRIKQETEMQSAALIAAGEDPSDASGLYIKTPNGFSVQSPWLQVSHKAMEFCHKFLSDFGMSPSARTRVSPSDPQMSLFGAKPVTPGGFNSL